MKPKPKVGQTLYSLNVGNAASRCEQELTPVKVTKVGRKYFYCEPGQWTAADKFYIDTWEQDAGGYAATACLYENSREYEDEKEAVEICRKIGEYFEYGRNRGKLPLAKLRKIMEIIWDE